MRYVFLQRQQPKKLNEEKKLILKTGDRFDFPDIDNWYAVAKPMHVVISNSKGRTKSMFFSDDNSLWFFPTGRGNEDTGEKFPFTKQGIKNAVRYTYLKNRQEPINEMDLRPIKIIPDPASYEKWKERNKNPKKIKFPNIGGFYVTKFHSSINDDGDSWYVFEPNGLRIGFIGAKTIHFPDNAIRRKGDQLSVELQHIIQRHSSEYGNFGSGVKSLKQIVRFLYLNWHNLALKKSKKKTDIKENVSHGNRTSIPELKGWSVIESTTEAGVPWWDIMDADGAWVGYLSKRKGIYRLVYTNAEGGQEEVKQDFGTNYVNAARYVFLQRQNPIVK